MTEEDTSPEAFAAFQKEMQEVARKLDPRNYTAGKYSSPDSFWDAKQQERDLLDDIDTKIRNTQAAIEAADRVVQIQSQPGWTEYVKALENSRVLRRQELELSSGTDAELRILQGRCRELGAMVSLVRGVQKNREGLALQLKSLQDDRALIVRPDGKINKPQLGQAI